MPYMPMRLATIRDPQSAEYVKAIALREGDRGKALALWQAARTFEPAAVTLLAHECLALLDLQRRVEVVDRLVAALPEHPRHPHLLNLFGVALFELGHSADALRIFDHLRTIDPDYPPLETSLANARSKLKTSRPASEAVRRAIDATIAAAATRPRPRLACCMIAKNEAEFIVGAIESVKGLADEIVVVDTGSTDDTVRLAREAGARVEHFAWIGDFSAARNASLDYATADWILCLDCDERLQKGSFSAVRAVMEEAEEVHRVFCVRIMNYTREGQFMSDGFSGRLFRNAPTMRFFGRVHEEVGGDRPDVSTDYRLDITFDHFGADPNVMREKAKDARNVELLEARLKEKPDDLLTWFYIGSQHGIGGRSEQAVRAFGRVVDLFERNPAGYSMVVRNLPVPFSYVGYVRGLTEQGRGSQAAEVGNRGLARFPDNPDLWYHTAFAYIVQQDYASARRYLEKALEVQVTGYSVIGMQNRSIKEWRAAKVLGDIDFEEGAREAAYRRYGGAIGKIPEGSADAIAVSARLVELACELEDFEHLQTHLLRYLAMRPTETHVALQVARFLREKRDLQAVYDLLTAAWTGVAALQTSPEMAIAVGQTAEAAGEDREALRWYETAMDLGFQEPPFLASVAQVLLRLGETAVAAQLLRLARAKVTAGDARSEK